MTKNLNTAKVESALPANSSEMTQKPTSQPATKEEGNRTTTKSPDTNGNVSVKKGQIQFFQVTKEGQRPTSQPVTKEKGDKTTPSPEGGGGGGALLVGAGTTEVSVRPTTRTPSVPGSSRNSSGDAFLSELPQPLPPPQLGRQSGRSGRNDTQPGAYMGAPGTNPQRLNNVDFSLVGAGGNSYDENGAPPYRAPEAAATANDGLAQARPVQDDAVPEMSARPFDADAASKRKAKEQKTFYIILAVLLAGALAVILALVFGKDKNKESDAMMQEPTPAPSDAPSDLPSQAPTSQLDFLLMNLPESTIEKLNNSSSPQWKGLDWLANHPTLWNMTESRKTQLFALATFYYAMDGENWPDDVKRDWVRYDLNECWWFSYEFGQFDEEGDWIVFKDVEWNAVEQETRFKHLPCEDDYEFQALSFLNMGLRQSNPFVPPEFALLSSMKILSTPVMLANTSIDHFLPPDFYKEASNTGLADSLKLLDLSANALTGQLPSEFGLFRNLTSLYVAVNDLTGQIPSQLGLLSELKALVLWRNSLSGSLPMLPPLDRLEVLENHITGSIPTSIGNMENFSYFDAARNLLTGSLPTEFGRLTQMDHIYLYDNQFLNGTLPTEFGKLQHLIQLQMFNNSFWGGLPSELGLLTSLERMRMHANKLSGSIPSQMAMMTSLNWLEIEDNLFTGTLPDFLGSLPLQHLHFQDNSFTGTLPHELSMITTLSYLHGDGNYLTGPLPTGLSMLPLARLTLHDNEFTGSIPTQYGNITGLLFLTLGSNPITGQLPSQIALLTNLVELDVSDLPLLTGSIPEEFGDLVNTTDIMSSKLRYLNISGTSITGTIPESLCALNNHNSTCSYRRTAVANLWVQSFWTDPMVNQDCALVFDCSDTLCGCGCECQ